MRGKPTLILAAVAAAVLFTRATSGDEGAPPTTRPAAPVQQTKVSGTPPPLAGRWLAIGWLNVPEEHTTTFAAFWEITVKDGKPVLVQRFVALPAAQQAAVDKANDAHQPWKPSDADLAQIRAAWDTLPAEDIHLARILHEISAPDGFDESLKQEERTRDALWVVRQRQDGDPTAAPVVRQVILYAALAASDGGYTGNLDGATIAVAPFPIPIPYKGSFRVYRLGDPAGGGILGRLLGLFEGCGARGSR